MKAISGSLFSLDVLRGLPADRSRGHSLSLLVGRALNAIGPASPPRQIADCLARPLLEAVDLDTAFVDDAGECVDEDRPVAGAKTTPTIGCCSSMRAMFTV